MNESGYDNVELKFATRLINSGPVILISSGSDRERAVMTAAWNMPVQKEPPLISVGIGRGHHTADVVKRCAEFVMNIPGWDMLDVVKYCGTVSGRQEDKYASGRFRWRSGEEVQAPVMEGMLGFLECRVERTVELPRLDIVIGRVVKCGTRNGYFHETWKLEEGEAAFVHHLGGNEFYRSGVSQRQ